MFAFRLFESRDEGMAARDAEQRAGNSNGNVGNTTSGGNIDSSQVEAVLLAAESQYMHQENEKVLI